MKEQQSVEDYLREFAIMDSGPKMDGSWVPVSVAMMAVRKSLEDELEYLPPTWTTSDAWRLKGQKECPNCGDSGVCETNDYEGLVDCWVCKEED